MDFLTIQEAAELTGFGPQKIRLLIRAGKLLAVDTSVGKRATFRIRREDLQRFLTPSELQQTDQNVAQVSR